MVPVFENVIRKVYVGKKNIFIKNVFIGKSPYVKVWNPDKIILLKRGNLPV